MNFRTHTQIRKIRIQHLSALFVYMRVCVCVFVLLASLTYCSHNTYTRCCTAAGLLFAALKAKRRPKSFNPFWCCSCYCTIEAAAHLERSQVRRLNLCGHLACHGNNFAHKAKKQIRQPTWQACEYGCMLQIKAKYLNLIFGFYFILLRILCAFINARISCI